MATTPPCLAELRDFLIFCRKRRLDPPVLVCRLGEICIEYATNHSHLLGPWAIGFFRLTLAISPPGHRCIPVALRDLGRSLCARFPMSGNKGDLSNGNRLQMQAADLREPGIDDHMENLGMLASVNYDQFQRFGAIEYLSEAIQLQEGRVACCPPSHRFFGNALDGLGGYLYIRSEQLGSMEDLQESIKLHRMAIVSACEHDGDYLRYIGNLANGLQVRYQRLGDPHDLAESITLNRTAIDSVHEPSDPGSYSNLANSLMYRFEESGSSSDLDEAILLYQRRLAVLDSRQEHIEATGYGNLAMAMDARFHHRGMLGDLDEAIRLNRMALNEADVRSPHRSVFLNNLAGNLDARYTSIGSSDDLEEAVVITREALKLRPYGHPCRSSSLLGLGNLLSILWRDSARPANQLKYLEEAVTLHREALSLRPKGHVDRANTLNSLAYVLSMSSPFYGNLQGKAMVDEAIGLYCDALDLRGEGNPARWHSLNTLSVAYRYRHDLVKKPDDGWRALKVMKEALAILPHGDSNRVRALYSMAHTYLDPSMPFHSWVAALPYLSAAITDNHFNAQTRLEKAAEAFNRIETLGTVHEDESRGKLLEVYVLTVRLLPRVAYFGLDIQSRLGALEKSENIALTGAIHALALSRPEFALELLEEGRAAFWTQALRLRTQFDELPQRLRQALVCLSRQLEGESYGVKSLGSRTKVELEQASARRRTESEQFEALVEEARALPGFERFMLHDTFATLAGAAADGPVVVLVPGHVSCNAIIVFPDRTAAHVHLSFVDDSLLQKWSSVLKDSNGRSRDALMEGRALLKVTKSATVMTIFDVLAELWAKVVKPIFDRISTKRSSGRDRSRLWWCPTGRFAFLPIHAAGIYSDGGDCCSSYFVSSYTPTLQALLNVKRTLAPWSRKEAKMLLAAVPKPYKGSKLPCTVEEVLEIKHAIPDDVLISLPPEDDASQDGSSGIAVDTLLRKLPDASILHLASHGYQDPSVPLDSGFLLRDGILTIAKLMPLPLPRAVLAFLSACETAKGDRAQPDQTVHLAAAMLFAGFKSVVGTMWSMCDVDGPVVATTVYRQLLGGGSEFLDPDDIPYALDAAVQKLRAEGHAPSRWATYIHIGV